MLGCPLLNLGYLVHGRDSGRQSRAYTFLHEMSSGLYLGGIHKLEQSCLKARGLSWHLLAHATGFHTKGFSSHHETLTHRLPWAGGQQAGEQGNEAPGSG